jgi:endonuclease/exonuclease/phosphatase family metal-dependent hydrolase
LNVEDRVVLPHKERIRRIAKIVHTYKCDIICFQELWRESHKKEMCKYFPNYFKYYHDQKGAFCGLGVDSGLLTLSTYPIQETRQLQFESKSWNEDIFAKKGVLEITIKHNNNFIKIMNTHLQGQVALDQMNEIYEFMDTKNCQNILCGDLNIRMLYKNGNWTIRI